MTAPTMTGKVVGLVTRPSVSRPPTTELLVFQHPMAGVQLPAGSLFDNEDPSLGARREVHEETGLGPDDDVELVEEIGTWVEPDSGLTRHAYHLRCLRETPDQWWVVTPDGGGLCWRCHWVPLDGTEPIHPMQRPWLDRVRPRLCDGRRELWSWVPLPPELVDETTVEVFYAPTLGDQWYSTSWLPRPGEYDDVANQSMALPITADGRAVVVRHGDGYEVIPGGSREAGESVLQTLERELLEEACARVVDAEPFGYLRSVRRDRDGVSNLHYGSRWWARVELDEWAPEWEMVERRLLPYTDVLRELPAWRFPNNERWITSAIEMEHRRSRR